MEHRPGPGGDRWIPQRFDQVGYSQPACEGIFYELLARKRIARRTLFLRRYPGRASIVARLSGDGSKRRLLTMGHEDVVPRGAGPGELWLWIRGCTRPAQDSIGECK